MASDSLFFRRQKKNSDERLVFQGGCAFLPRPVYYIECPKDNTVLVGIRVSVQQQDDGNYMVAWWNSGGHERRMIASSIQYDAPRFSFERHEREGGGCYTFSPMTLELYNAHVKERTISKRDFATTDDVVNAFLAEM